MNMCLHCKQLSVYHFWNWYRFIILTIVNIICLAKVQTNESVLIHGGASGVGTAAIQLCLQAKARPFVTAGSASKIQAAHSLGAVVGFNYKEDDIGAKVLEATGGDVRGNYAWFYCVLIIFRDIWFISKEIQDKITSD